MASKSNMRWLPLESNPDVMNKYAAKLGVSNSEFLDVIDLGKDYLKEAIPKPVLAILLLFPRKDDYVKTIGVADTYEFTDVFGFDPDLLCMVPRPVAAVLLLYPLNEKTTQSELGKEDHDSKDVYFMKQTIGNACGTIGLIHALCNNTEYIKLDEGKHLSEFLKATKSMSPEERGKKLESDEGYIIDDINMYMAFSVVHEESAQEGQTTAPSRDEKVNLHFVAFVHSNGGLYELDGRKGAPVNHGNTTSDTLLEDTVEVVKKFMARDPENIQFTVVALAKK